MESSELLLQSIRLNLPEKEGDKMKDRLKKRKRCNRLSTLVFFSLLLFGQWSYSQMIAQITTDVVTEFATYHPLLTEFTPNVPSFSVEPDFSNVYNYPNLEYCFTSMDSAFLVTNHFTVKKNRYQQIYDIYNESTWDGVPVFVTTDAVLHTYHILFDKLLAEIEMQKFIPALDGLTETLLNEMEITLGESTKEETREAAFYNLAFFCVANKLLKGDEFTVPDTVLDLVEMEITLIDNHTGFAYSPILGNFSQLDYSQFQPRGHYTKNDTLSSYFLSMMWYGWTIFTMEPDLFGDLARRHTLQALLLVQKIHTLQWGADILFDLWSRIYKPTVFFAGKTDDPAIQDYRAIADLVYGQNFLSLTADSLADATLLDQFMTEAQKLPEPEIPNWIYTTYCQYKGFRFMGQRYTPDSYIFTHLVDPDVPYRFFPKGLDIMAILGSEQAHTLLDSLYGETRYANYTHQMDQFQTEFLQKESSEWAQNLYWNWLYTLMPFLYLKGEGYPFFMQTQAWANKELMTALASWAELRHDTILYAKQSMSPCCLPPGPPRSYVEANPHLYGRLASLVHYTRDGLVESDLIPETYEDRLDLFEKLLLFLHDVAIKELENTPLTDSEYENIFCFGKVIQDLIEEGDPSNPWEGDSDDMAVIADVHTDSNTDQCLEEGVGYPLVIYVIVNEGGLIRLTRGAIFSYYEFIQPISQRLTDEVWRQWLTEDIQPPMPEWADSFMDPSEEQPSFIPYSPEHLYDGQFTSIEYTGDKKIPEKIRLYQNYPNPFNPETLIRFDLFEPTQLKLIVYNLLGQPVRILFSGRKPAGTHTIFWDGRDRQGYILPSGNYLYKIETEKVQYTRIMSIIR